MKTPIQYLLAERNTVQDFLARSVDESPIIRNNWLSRLRAIEAEIAEERSKTRPARTAITYKGRPVVASYGILSTFGLAATRAYTKIVQEVVAQTYSSAPLGTRGAVTRSREIDLLITGPAYGSFGFELEEQFDGQTSFLQDKTPVAMALETTQALFHGTTKTNDELAQLTAGIDQRVITSMRAFLSILSKNDAVCAIETEDSRFHFDTVDDVRRSLIRIERNNIERKTETLRGYFAGMLPGARTFEFILEGTQDKIYGKLERTVEDVDPINSHLNETVEIQVLSQRIGNGRPYYVLLEAPQWGYGFQQTQEQQIQQGQ